MTVVEAALSALTLLFAPQVLPFLGLGAIFGLVVGVIPGLSGHFAMAIVVSFLYAMAPAPGIAFLLAAHATVAQGGGLTAILFSIPGTGQNAATLLDGPAMRDRGQAGVAVGAAMTACFMGATFGAIALALLIPVLREAVLTFGPPEIFLAALLGLVFVAILGGRDLMRALIAGLLGLVLSMIGFENASNAPRFTFGFEPLADGISLVPAVLGIFAVSEMMHLWKRGGALLPEGVPALSTRDRQGQLFRGMVIALRHWWLVARCSAIGTTLGIIPGLGSATAAFVAYGHARQTSKTAETFGQGNIEGVIAPEAANDAVEGGALASTVAFGIPGSSSMAILLSGFAILGLETGPRLLGAELDILFLMIFTIILGNFIGTIGGMVIANPMVHLTTVRSNYIVPIILSVIVCGAYAGSSSLFDIVTALAFGAIGYLCSQLRYSRAALLIGFVLGHPVEYNLHLALQLDGPFFFLQPIPLVMCLIGLVFVGYTIRGVVRTKRAPQSPTGKRPPEALADVGARITLLRTETVVLAFVAVFALAASVETILNSRLTSVVPQVVLVPLLVITIMQLRRTVSLLRAQDAVAVAAGISHRLMYLIASAVLLWLGIVVIGQYPALFLFAVILMGVPERDNWRFAAMLAAATTGLLWLVFTHFLGAKMYDGLVYRVLAGYRDF